MANEANVMTSHNLLNYSGMLFNKGNTKTPFSTMIGGRRRNVNHFEFPVSLAYTSGGGTSQPEITESASLTAPAAEFVTRAQATNITQIFQKALAISYAKQSGMGTLSGLNYAGQQANPATELDFQIGAAMAALARDIEYTFVNGVYNKAGADDEANKTRGMIAAIASNVMDAADYGLGYWMVVETLKKIYDSQGMIDGLVLLCDGTAMLQLNADAKDNDMTIAPAARNINGINISTLVTPYGEIGVRLGECLPVGTALIVNPGICSPVYQDVPGKGNFFLEPLSKTGAADKYQIYGQLGLDYAAEWYHAKITGLSNTFTKPVSAKKVYFEQPIATVETDPVPTSATLNKSEVVEAETVAVEAVNYNVRPATDPTLAYLWQIRAASGTVWNDLTSAYTGYNTDTLTVKAGDAGKHFRCKITCTGSATGIIYTDEATAVAAD